MTPFDILYQDVTGQQQWSNTATRPATAMTNMMWSAPAAQSWSMASYAPSSSWQSSWSNGNGMTNGNGAMWYPAPAAAAAATAERVTAERSMIFQVSQRKQLEAYQKALSKGLHATAICSTTS